MLRYKNVYGIYKKLDIKTQGTAKFIALMPLVAPSLYLGATARAFGYKFRRSLCFEVCLF